VIFHSPLTCPASPMQRLPVLFSVRKEPNHTGEKLSIRGTSSRGSMALLTTLMLLSLCPPAGTPSPASSSASPPPAPSAPPPCSRTGAWTTLQDVEAAAAAVAGLLHLQVTPPSNTFHQVMFHSPLHPVLPAAVALLMEKDWHYSLAPPQHLAHQNVL